jgi:hypothetical protein
MTQEKYMEMCESLGTDPVPSEIPPAFSDLTFQSQDVMQIFMYLKDDWTSMGGYVGKDLSNITKIFELFNIDKEDWLLYIEILQVIITEQTNYINKKIKSESRTKTSGKTNRARSSNPGQGFRT